MFILFDGYDNLCVRCVTFELPIAEYAYSVVDLLSDIESFSRKDTAPMRSYYDYSSI